MSTSSSDTVVNTGGLAGQMHWALRIAIAAVFLFHGLDKVFNAGSINFLADTLGLGTFLAWLVALGEIATGLLALIGGVGSTMLRDAATRLAGLGAIVIMIGAIALVHWPNGWAFSNNGMEFQVVLLLIGLVMLIRGKDL
jgi:putative oxidoreductase